MIENPDVVSLAGPHSGLTARSSWARETCSCYGSLA